MSANFETVLLIAAALVLLGFLAMLPKLMLSFAARKINQLLFMKVVRSLGLLAGISVCAVLAFTLLVLLQRQFAYVDSGIYQRAMASLVQLQTEEVDRYNLLPDGTLVAIHGQAQGALLLTDPDVGISGVGFVLYRDHQFLYRWQSETITRSRFGQTRSYTQNQEWRHANTDLLPSLRWLARIDQQFSFGPIAQLPGVPGKRIAMFPNNQLQAKLRSEGFVGLQDDCLVNPGSDSAPAERLCWYLYQAGEQTFFGAKQGQQLVDWHSGDGKISAKLEMQRTDPRIAWQQEISYAEELNTQRRSLSAWSNRMTLGRIAILLALSVVYLMLVLVLLKQWSANSALRHMDAGNNGTKLQRSAKHQLLTGLLLGALAPIAFFVGWAVPNVLPVFFAFWLLAPLLFWRLSKPALNEAPKALFEPAKNPHATAPRSVDSSAKLPAGVTLDLPALGVELLHAWCWHRFGSKLRRAQSLDWLKLKRERIHAQLFLCFAHGDEVIIRNMDHYVHRSRHAIADMHALIQLCRATPIRIMPTEHDNCLRLALSDYEQFVQKLTISTVASTPSYILSAPERVAFNALFRISRLWNPNEIDHWRILAQDDPQGAEQVKQRSNSTAQVLLMHDSGAVAQITHKDSVITGCQLFEGEAAQTLLIQKGIF